MLRYFVNSTGRSSLESTFTGGVSQSVVQNKTWENTPGFFELRRKKYPDLPMQPFSVTGSRTSQFKGSFSYATTGNRGLPRFDYVNAYDSDNICGPFPLLFVTPSIATAIDEKARSRVLSDLKDMKVNLAQVFAERRMTANMIANTATRLAFSAHRLKRGDLKGSLGALGSNYNYVGLKPNKELRRSLGRDRGPSKTPFSNQWLELQYGWLPLLSDIYGSAELLANIPYRKSEVRCVGSASQSLEDFFRDTHTSSAGTFSRLHRRVTRTKIKYIVFRSNSNPVVQTLSQMGISNPALLAWEVLPYSFVVDWFIPIGNYLENLDATAGLSFTKGCKVVHTVTTCSTTVSQHPSNAFFYKVDMKGSQTYYDIARTRLTSFPVQSLPSFKNPFSFNHVANAIALLRQSFKR